MDYLGQRSAVPGIARMARKENDAWQSILERTSPGLMGSIKHAGRVVNDRISGRLTAETRGNIERSTAYRALAGGFGADSAAGHALTARDIGRTTDDLQTEGFRMLPANLSLADQVNPVNPAALLFTPQQLLARRDQQSLFNTQVSNSEKAYNTSLDLENQNAKFTALMNQAGLNYQLNGAQIQAKANADQATSQGIMQIGGAVAGMGGMGTATGGINWTKLGGSVFGGGGGVGSSGGYSSMGAAQSAAPYTSSFSLDGGAFYPRAAAV
jgi:hypothetical protein